MEERQTREAALLAEAQRSSLCNNEAAVALGVPSLQGAESALAAGNASSERSIAEGGAAAVPEAAVTVLLTEAPHPKPAEAPSAERKESGNASPGAPGLASPTAVSISASPCIAAFCPDDEEDCLAELD